MEGRNYPYAPTTIPRDRGPDMRFDPRFFCKPPGILKSVEFILGISCYGIVAFSGIDMYAVGMLLRVFSLTSALISSCILCFYVYHVVEYYYRIQWLKIELVIYLCFSIMYLILAALSTKNAGLNDGFTAASVFGYLGMLVYFIDFILKILHIRSGEPAQGDYTNGVRRISEFV